MKNIIMNVKRWVDWFIFDKKVYTNSDQGCPNCNYDECICSEDINFCQICDRTIDKCDCYEDKEYND